MLKKLIVTTILSSTLLFSNENNENFTSDILTGDVKLSCEAILCLASSTRPKECKPSIKKYFSIKSKKWKNTLKKRKRFLKLCPVDSK